MTAAPHEHLSGAVLRRAYGNPKQRRPPFPKNSGRDPEPLMKSGIRTLAELLWPV